jgi:hypothetical protein
VEIEKYEEMLQIREFPSRIMLVQTPRRSRRVPFDSDTSKRIIDGVFM